MRNVFKSGAILVAAGMSLSQTVSAADEPSADAVVVEKVTDRRFRLVNNSSEHLTYMKWVNQEDSPVPYCKYPNETVSICARDMYLDSNRNPALQETRLKPGKSINFNALKNKAVAVGVQVRIGEEEKIVWCDLD